MKRAYTKSEELIKLLKAGWEIFTERGSAPYNPIYFHVYHRSGKRKMVHPKTIESLISKKVISGTDSIHGKYKLLTQ